MAKPGFRCAAEKRVVREATGRGWEFIGRNGTNHCQLRWPATGQVVRLPSSLDDGYARRVLRHLQKIEACGA